MDSRPFLELDLEDPRPNALQGVKRFAKDDLDLEEILSTASELKYTSAIKRILAEQNDSPDEEFCKYFFNKVNPGERFAGNAKDSFIPLVKKAFNQFVSEKVSDRLRSALETEGTSAAPKAEASTEDSPAATSDIVTTEEELEAFRIVRAIAAQTIDPERVFYRDAKTYMSITEHFGSRLQWNEFSQDIEFDGKPLEQPDVLIFNLSDQTNLHIDQNNGLVALKFVYYFSKYPQRIEPLRCSPTQPVMHSVWDRACAADTLPL